MLHIINKKNSFFSGLVVYLISNIINASIPFALLPFLTRYMSPREYGQVAMFQVLLGILGALVGLNIVGAANRKYYDDDMTLLENRYFIASCLQIIVLSGACVFGLVFLMRTYLSDMLGLEKSWILLAVMLSVMLCIVQLRLGQWHVRNKSVLYGFLQVFQGAIIVFFAILFVVFYEFGVFGRIAGQVVGVCVGALFSLYFLKKDGLLSFFIWSPRCLKEALSFGVPLIPHMAGNFLLMSVDRLVVNIEIGLADAGIYAVSAQVVTIMSIIFDALNKAYVPWLFERLKLGRMQDKQLIVKCTYAWFGFIALVVVMVYLYGPWLITIVAGEQYSSAGDFIGWLALGQGFMGMYLMVTNYIFYSRKTGMLSLVTMSSGLVNILLLFLFIRIFGLKGAAIAFGVAMGFRFLCTWFVAQRRYPMPWLNFHQNLI